MPVVRMMLEAAAVAADFWQALGRDDDDAAAALLSSAWEPDASVVNLAANYRAARQIEQATCAVMGTVTHGDLLAADRVRLFHHPVAVSTPLAPFEAITVWRLELVHEDGRWRVDRSSDRQTIQRVSWGDTAPERPDGRVN